MLADDIGVTGGYNIYSDMANTSYVTYNLHSVPRQAKLCHYCASRLRFIISMTELTASIGFARKCRVLDASFGFSPLYVS